MAMIINLRRARKARQRAEKDERAAQARAASGRTKAEKSLSRAGKARMDRLLDGHQRMSPDPVPEPVTPSDDHD